MTEENEGRCMSVSMRERELERDCGGPGGGGDCWLPRATGKNIPIYTSIFLPRRLA